MILSLENLNPNVLNAQYAVRGPIVNLAQKLEKEGRKMWYFNIGNPQQLGQPPLTYVREILSLLLVPDLLDDREKLVELGYAPDNIARAEDIRRKNPIGLGAYSQSAGMPWIRDAIAEFINQRDGIPTSSANIFMVDGASKGVDLVLSSIITENVGIMTPIPQYPLYSADIALFGGKQIPYYLDEENQWTLNGEMLENSYRMAKDDGIDVKLIVIINPNNPTGSVLTRKNIEMVLDFANRHNLMIIADEVYQENVYEEGDAFYSFAKVSFEMGINIPIFSLHSTSKGFFGECGLRGGYLELRNVQDDVLLELLKVRSIGLCPNTVGQITTYLMINPPVEGETSYKLYVDERNSILSGMARKAKTIAETLDTIEGISCPTPRGAMYLFPKIELPNRDYDGKPADFTFAKFLVEKAGIVTVPGSGFGQLPNTWHLRMTFLPPEDKIPEIMEDFKSAYQEFINLK